MRAAFGIAILIAPAVPAPLEAGWDRSGFASASISPPPLFAVPITPTGTNATPSGAPPAAAAALRADCQL